MLDLQAIFEQGSHEGSESLVDSIVDARDSVAYCGGFDQETPGIRRMILLSNIGILMRHTNGSSLFHTDRNKSPGTKNTLRMRLTMPRGQWIPRAPHPRVSWVSGERRA